MTGPKTEKLYLNDPYTVSFRARVVDSVLDADGRTAIVLDRTFLYPESGGQTADAGTIGPAAVVDVQEGGGETVVHYLEDTAESGEQHAVPAAGDDVECNVDWPRRFDHMQQHTGQHVLSRAFIQTANLHTVSFHLGEETCTIDLDGSGFDEDVVARAEKIANEIITDNRPVNVRTVPVSELEGDTDLELRRALPEGVTEARLVAVADFDVIPCCGTHVRSTGELGLIKVLKSEKAKGLFRVSFKVGARAMSDYRDKHDIVQSLGNRLTTSVTDVTAKVEKLLFEGQQLRKDVKRVSQALAGYETQALLDAAEDWNGVKIIVRHFHDRGDDFIRMVSTGLKRAPGVVAILGAGTGGVVCSASDGVGVDFAAIAVEPAKAAGGSGGGKGGFAQLRLHAGADVGKFLEETAENVKRSIT